MNEDSKKLLVGAVGMLAGVMVTNFAFGSLFKNSATAKQAERAQATLKRMSELNKQKEQS